MTFSAIQPFEALAVVGMDVAWAGCDGLVAFERMIFEARQQFVRPEGGGQAASPTGFGALLDKVSKRALGDAGINIEKNGMQVAAFAAYNAPVNIDWPWASRFADLSAEANPLAAAVDLAQRMLAGGEADAVLFAAGGWQINPPVGTLLALDSVSAMGYDREVHGWRLGEGCAAVVLMRQSQAQREGRRIYAVIRGIGLTPGRTGSEAALPIPPVLEDVRGSIQAALTAVCVSPDQIGYIETFASGMDALDGIEIAGLVQTYRQPVQDLSTALGSAQANVGYLGAASGLAGLIRAGLCLYHRMIPGVPGWSAPKLPALWRGAPFYMPGDSRAWFEKTSGPGRLAGLNVIGLSGSFAHLVLAESVEEAVHPNPVLAQGGFNLFPLAGNDLGELVSELESLRQSLNTAMDLNLLASQCYHAAESHPDARFALSVVGHTVDEIAKEIELALKAIPEAWEKNAEWQTPLGSYFTANPAGRQGGVALVYPGAFNSYPGVGKDLFRLFPELYRRAAEVTTDLGRVTRERMLYPRSLTAVSKEALALLETQLLADPIAMLISGTAMTIFYTHILQDAFKVRPQAAFGYSLGENAMMFATGVWCEGDQASTRLEESETFRVRLAGPQQAIREHWGLPAQNGHAAGPLWSNFLVMAAPEKVQAALVKEPRVYMTHINTPRQVVIGGDPEACKRVITELHCSSLQAPFDYALHCEVMRSEYGGLAELHDWPVGKMLDMRMYSASDYGPIAIERREISQKIAHMLTSPLDFPRLVRKVYDDGARVFIEAGAGSNCARWIDETLKGSPHLALSMNRRGTDDYTTLVRTLARLHSHRVPMDLSILYTTANEKVSL